MKTKLIIKIGSRVTRSPGRGQATISQAATSVQVEDYESARPFSEIPSPKGYPVIGHMLDLMKKENQKTKVDYHSSLIKEFGSTYKLKVPGKSFIFIADPSDSRTLLSKDGTKPYIPAFEAFELMRKEMDDLVSRAGFWGQGEDWLEFRKAVQQDLMRPKSALFYINDMSDLMEEVNAKIETCLNVNGEISGLQSIMHEFALEAVGIMFIGTKLGVLKGTEEGKQMITSVGRFFKHALDINATPRALLKYSTAWKECSADLRTITEICKKNIATAIERHKTDGSLAGTVIEKLIKKCGVDSDIPVVMAIDALFAGIETTGNQGVFLLYHLAANPAKQEKLSEEILKIIGKDGKMTEESLSEMRHLKACQMESQRLVNVVPMNARQTKVDMVLGGYQIPKHTIVVRHGAINSVHAKYFPNPDEFIPERWIRGSPEFNKVDPYANLPFGHGPRACIGQRFARLELYMLALKTVQKYKLEYHGPKVEVDWTGIGHVDGDIAIKFIKR